MRTKTALIGAGAGAVLLVLTWLVALRTSLGARADLSILHGFVGLQRPRVDALAVWITELCNPKPFVAFGAVIVLVALLRRRPRIALGRWRDIALRDPDHRALKDLLPSARALPGVAQPVGSWPSGHATAAMSLALCAALVAPRRLRPIVAVAGAAFAVAVGYSTLTLIWHYPSDVLGGFLVAGTWTLLVLAVLFRVEASDGLSPTVQDGGRVSLRSALTPPAVGCALAATLAGVVLLVRPHQLLSYARIHPAFVIGAAAIGAMALLVATTVMLVRR